VINAMGGSVNYRRLSISGGEPAADLEVRYSRLHGTVIEGDLIPTLIDELPIIAVLASVAEGETIIRNAEELKVKESDRLSIMVDGLSRMGVDIEGTDDGMIIRGGRPLHGAIIDSHKDHRIAMAFAIASLAADGETEIRDAECVDISYPAFYRDLAHLLRP
jgi:3-phosphoshikimate 1-carboxyvinyltransferase